MSQADDVYYNIIDDIIWNGTDNTDEKVRTRWEDGTPAYTRSLVSRRMFFDNTEVPILTAKEVKWESAIKETPIWMWQKKSNRVQDLRDMGCNIWNQWELPDGTIGKSYGHQLGKKVRKVKVSAVRSLIESGYLSNNIEPIDEEYYLIDQVDYLLYQLKVNPSSRRMVTSLWNIDELDEMSLEPCVWHTQWLVKQGQLHLIVGIRSNDMGVGNPFNVFQYYVIQRMIAQVTGYELGTLTFNINDAHIYDRHIDSLQEQIDWFRYPAPTLWVNPDVKSFYDFTINDFRLDNYLHGKFVRLEVAE